MLTYEFEVILLVKVSTHTHCMTTFQEDFNNTTIREARDSLPSVRGNTYLLEVLYKIRTAYNWKVKQQLLWAGDFCLKEDRGRY